MTEKDMKEVREIEKAIKKVEQAKENYNKSGAVDTFGDTNEALNKASKELRAEKQRLLQAIKNVDSIKNG